MDEVVPNLCRIIAVLCCGKPDQSFFIDVDLDRIDTGEENIETEVKLETIYKEGSVNILLVIKVILTKSLYINHQLAWTHILFFLEGMFPKHRHIK